MSDKKQFNLTMYKEDKERLDRLRKENGVLTYQMIKLLLDCWEENKLKNK